MIGELIVMFQALIMDYIPNDKTVGSLKVSHCVTVFTVQIHNHKLMVI